MASSGIIPGMLTCILSGGVAAFGLYLLSRCAVKTPHRRASFFAIAQLTFPKAAVLFDAAIAIKCFGVSIRSALLFLSNLSAFSQLFRQLPYHHQNSHAKRRCFIVPRSDVTFHDTAGVGTFRRNMDLVIYGRSRASGLPSPFGQS